MTQALPLELLVKAKHALGTTQEGIGRLLGVSRSTVVRWTARSPAVMLLPSQRSALVRAVHAADPALGAAIAKATGETLESLGVVLPEPARPREPPAALVPHLADAVVCAAAEAASISPATMRPALLAALRRAHALGLGVDALIHTLARATKEP